MDDTMSDEQRQQQMLNEMSEAMNRAAFGLQQQQQQQPEKSDNDDENNNNNNTTSSGNMSPSSMLAQVFNKSTMAAMGLDPNANINNNAALAALAASFASQFNQTNAINSSTSTINNASSPSNLLGGGNKPKPPALARVSCHICRKELCNKYFLKSHLLNAHQITADDFLMNSLTDNTNMMSQMSESVSKKFNLLNGLKSNIYQNSQEQEQEQINENDDDDEIEEGQSLANGQQQQQNTADMIAAKQSIMSINALLNYNKIMNGDTSLQTSQTAAATAAAAALMAVSNGNGAELTTAGSSFGSACNMQPFLFECNDDAYSANFVPCMVYLPVKTKLNASSITIKVTLKPLDQTEQQIDSNNNNNNNNSENGSEHNEGVEDEENEEVDENSQS